VRYPSITSNTYMHCFCCSCTRPFDGCSSQSLGLHVVLLGFLSPSLGLVIMSLCAVPIVLLIGRLTLASMLLLLLFSMFCNWVVCLICDNLVLTGVRVALAFGFIVVAIMIAYILLAESLLLVVFAGCGC